MKNILLPTDFSGNSKNAINYALQLFKNESCTFYVLNVQKVSQYTTDDLMTAPTNQTIYQSVISDTKKQLVSYTKILRKQYANENYNFKEEVDYDRFTDAVKQVVKLRDIELIIMGTNGATNASEVFFGSNTLKVIRKVNCPVLAIPNNFIYHTPKTVLYVMNSNNEFSDTILAPLKMICLKHKSEVRILKIKEDDVVTVIEYDNKKHVKKFFEDTNYSFHTITNVPPPLAIDSFVQIMNVDMTAIVIERESFLHRLFSGSETADISYNSRIPLLIMHPE